MLHLLQLLYIFLGMLLFLLHYFQHDLFGIVFALHTCIVCVLLEMSIYQKSLPSQGRVKPVYTSPSSQPTCGITLGILLLLLLILGLQSTDS